MAMTLEDMREIARKRGWTLNEERANKVLPGMNKVQGCPCQRHRPPCPCPAAEAAIQEDGVCDCMVFGKAE